MCGGSSAEADSDDGLEFQDAQSGDEEVSGSSQEAPRLPSSMPTSASVLAEVNAVRAAFQPDGATALPLTEAVSRCRDKMASDAPPFFAFTRVLGEDQRHAVWVLFGVCQEFAEATTVGELDAARSHLRRIFNVDLGGCGADLDNVWGALRTALGRYAVIRRPFEDYADGVAARPGRGLAFETVDDMLTYAYRSAGVVGLIALPVLAEEVALDPQVVEAAIALGMALQLVDMLNCLGHHFRTHGICWTPKECLRRHGLEFSELESNLLQTSSSLVEDPRWQDLMRELLGLVGPFLRAAACGGEKLPRGGRIAVRAAVRMARRMLSRIEARGYNSLGPHEEMFSWRIVGDMAGAVLYSEPDSSGSASDVVWGYGGL